MRQVVKWSEAAAPSESVSSAKPGMLRWRGSSKLVVSALVMQCFRAMQFLLLSFLEQTVGTGWNAGIPLQGHQCKGPQPLVYWGGDPGTASAASSPVHPDGRASESGTSSSSMWNMV
eukprot:5372953-Amphidinium_carterae.2